METQQDSRLVVGVDCDNVLREFDDTVIKLARKEGLIVDQPETWGWLTTNSTNGNTLAHHIWESRRWAKEVFEEAPVVPGASQAYKLMCEDPNLEVRVVTSQRQGTEHHTDRWLKANGFTSHHKTIYSHKKYDEGIDILIDDYPKNIALCVENNVKAILISRPFNVYYAHKPRVNNLNQAYEWIKTNILHTELAS